MRHLVNIKNRAFLFQEISKEVWEDVKFQRKAKVDPSEIGITKSIMSLIRNIFDSDPSFGIFASQGYKEDDYGSDMDIFIHVRNKKYIWFALQAKVLKVNGTYGYLDKKSGEIQNYQWEKLHKISRNNNCVAGYLLYNGDFNYKCQNEDKVGLFNEDQFGCSFIEINDFINYRCFEKNNFEEFHDKSGLIAKPWRNIMKVESKGLKLYTESEILKRTKVYKVMSEMTDFGEPEYFNFIGAEDYEITNSIKELSDKCEWQPAFTLIFR